MGFSVVTTVLSGAVVGPLRTMALALGTVPKLVPLILVSVTRTMSEKQALTVLATTTSAWPVVSGFSRWGRCSHQ